MKKYFVYLLISFLVFIYYWMIVDVLTFFVFQVEISELSGISIYRELLIILITSCLITLFYIDKIKKGLLNNKSTISGASTK